MNLYLRLAYEQKAIMLVRCPAPFLSTNDEIDN